MPCPSLNYTGAKQSNHPWQNYIQEVDINVETYWMPATLRELVYILRRAEDEGKRVHVVGGGYSFEDLAATPDWMVDLSKLGKDLGVLVGPGPGSRALTDQWRTRQFGAGNWKLVHVQAGARLYDLCRTLDRRNLALPTLGGFLGQHVAGALSTSTHGSDIDQPPLCDLVHAVHLVTVGGQEIWIESASRPLTDDDSALREALQAGTPENRACHDLRIVRDDDLLNSVVVGMGRFGIIYSVVLEVTSAFHLGEYAQELHWNRVAAALREGGVRDNGSLNALLTRPPTGLGIAGNYVYLDVIFNTRNNDTCWVRRRWITPNTEDLNLASGANFLCLPGMASTVLLGVAEPLRKYALLLHGLGPFRFKAQGRAGEIETVILPMLAKKAAEPHLTGGAALAMALNAIWKAQLREGEGMLSALIDEVANEIFKGAVFPENSQKEGRRSRNWHIAAGSADPGSEGDCYRGNSIEIIFGLNTNAYLDFIETVLAHMRNYRQSGWLSVRFSRRSQALLSMHNVDHSVACSIEITSLKNLEGNEKWMRWIEQRAIAMGGRPHWGQQNNLSVAQVRHLYPQSRLLRWQTKLHSIVGNSVTFSNDYTKKRGLEPPPSIALQAHNGQYVRAKGGGGGTLEANETVIDEDAVFSLVDLNPLQFDPDGSVLPSPVGQGFPRQVALQAGNGQYVGAAGGGGGSVDAGRFEAREQETFVLLDLPNDKVALRTQDGHYVGAAGGGGGALDAGRTALQEHETFRLVEVRRPWPYVALQTPSGHYVGAAGGGGGALDAGRTAVREHETFKMLQVSTNEVVLRAYDGHYVGASGGGGGAVDAGRTQPREYERFTLIELDGNKVALKTRNGHYIGVSNGGGGGIDAGRTALGAYETFRLINAERLSRQAVALRAHSGHYVGASGGGGGGIDAGRTRLGTYEMFTLVELGNYNVALQAHSGHYVGVSGGGGGGIDAGRTAIQEYETFRLIRLGGGKVAFQTANGHYVGASGGGGGAIDAGRTAIGTHETFVLELI